MAQELIYTSAPKGLRLGSSGFCTVACTRGMAPNYVEILESLSGYTPVFPLNHPDAGLNPVSFSHYRYTIGGKQVSILSRVTAGGADYTGRPNKLAYHLVLDSRERAAGGPAWVMRQPGIMLEEWDGEPRFLERPRQIPMSDSTPALCEAWKNLMGDAGWAGVLAQAFLDNPRRPSFLIFEPGMPMLELIAEALRLLAPEQRWDVTFNTYFNGLPAGSACVWRCCLRDSPVLSQARRLPAALILDLSAAEKQGQIASLRMAQGSPLIECARNGAKPPSLLAVSAKVREQPLEMDEEPEGIRPHPAYWPAARRAPQYEMREPVAVAPRRHTLLGLKTALVAAVVLLCLSVTLNVGLLLKPGRAEPRQENGRMGGQDGQNLKASNEQVEDAKVNPESRAVIAPQAEEKAGAPDSGQQRNIALLGKLGEMVSAVRGGATWSLPTENVSDEWRVTSLGWWEGQAPAAEHGVRFEPAGNTLRITGPDASGVRIEYVTIEARKGGIEFRPGPGKPQQKQILRARLNALGWLELSRDSDKLAVFTTARPLAQIRMRSVAGGEKYEGRVDFPAVCRGLDPWWNHGQENVSYETSFDESGRLRVTIKFDRKSIKADRVKQIKQAVFERPLELHAGGETVAAFTLVPDDQ